MRATARAEELRALGGSGEILRGGRGGGEHVNNLVNLGELHAGDNHPVAPCKAQSAAGIFEARIAANDDADGCAVNVRDASEIENSAGLFVLQKLLHFLLDAAAIGAGVNAAAEGDQHDALWGLIFGNFKNQWVGSVRKVATWTWVSR